MVQGFPELHRIDQGLAGPIFPVQLVQVLAGDQERGDPFSVVAYADLCQITAACQQKSTPEDVRNFQVDQKNHPLFKIISCHQYVPPITNPFRLVKHLSGLTNTYSC